MLLLALAAVDPTSFFEERIRPLLAARCIGCHGDARVSNLRLDSREGMLAGGRLGPAVVPGNANASLAIQAVSHSHANLKMPPGDKLTSSEVAVLRKWIDAGAVWPERRPVSSTSGKITAEHRRFWSFTPIRNVLPPYEPGRSPIDRFLAAKQNEAGVKPMPRAPDRVLIRRLSFDLTGLPPGPAVRATIPDYVDMLLKSPQFGERWGRHWLDVARYGEDDVLGLSQEKYPNAWRYRDWVIEAFNRDLPYDTFVKAQVAADLMPPQPGFDLRPALGFFGLGPWQYTVSPPPQARADERHDRIDTLTRGVLGLTVACARCHDHKFDPFTTGDYYALAGVFASSEYREYPLAPQEEVDRYDRHQQLIRDQQKKIADFTNRQRDQLAEIFAHQLGSPNKLNPLVRGRWRAYLAKAQHDHPFAKLPPAELQKLVLAIMAEKREIDEERRQAVERSRPRKGAAKTRLPNGFETYDDFCPGCDVAVRSLERDKYVLWNDLFKDKGVLWLRDTEIDALLGGEWLSHLKGLRAELDRLKSSSPKPYPFLHGIADKDRPYDLKIHLRGDPYSLGAEQPRRFIEVLTRGEPDTWSHRSGRMELAEAVVHQPIMARVAANRVWMHLFGRPLVGSPSNFGKYGDRPTHPDLLEFLAGRLVASGWSIKSLVREIVLTEAYQRSSARDAANDAVDGDNKWFWRANRRRLDAEALRDSVLFAAGTLDPAVGGPSGDLDDSFTRRAVYGRISRFRLAEPLVLFDFPNPSITAERRNTTHVPLQRLFFLNSAFVARQAEALAARLGREGGLAHACPILFGRDATSDELRLGREFLAGGGTMAQLSLVMLASNEFLFVD